MVSKGLFIVLEGTDGCGKSTQIRKIKQYLMDLDYHVKLIREPGGTDIGEEIRNIVLDKKNYKMSSTTEMLLYAASRAQLVEEKIIPALNQGTIVICDRFVYSSLVYQGMGRKLGIENVWNINKAAIGNLMPDIAIFLDLPVEKSLQRLKNGIKDRIESEGFSFHKSVYDSYLRLCENEKFKLQRIDADRDIEIVFTDLKEIINKKLFDNESRHSFN